MSFFKLKKTKVVKLSNGMYIPLWNGGKWPVNVWYGIDSDLNKWIGEANILRYCQCADEETAERILFRKNPPPNPMIAELKGLM